MNRYYIDYHGNAFAVRCTGVQYDAEAARATRIPGDKSLKFQALVGMIPVYVTKDGKTLERVIS